MITVVGSNDFGNITESVSVTVVRCTDPTVELEYGTLDQPTTYHRKKDGIILSATVRWNSGTECADTNNALEPLKWEQVKITGNGVSSVTKSTDINQRTIDWKKPEILKYNMSNMEFGDYKIILKTRLYQVPTDHTAFIRVVKEKLYVYIVGDIYRGVAHQIDQKNGDETIRVSNNFTVDASKSKDPNIEDQSGLQFEWSCRVLNKSTSDVLGPDSKCNSSSFEAIGGTEKVLHLSTDGFAVSTTYEFRVNMTSDGVSIAFIQKIKFVPGNPPELILR